MASPERVSQVVRYILEHFYQKTGKSSFYSYRVLDDIHKVASARKGVKVSEHKETDLNEIIENEHLKPEETARFIESSFRDGQLRTTGTDIDRILPPMSRFGGGAGSNRQEKNKIVIEKIQEFFERYFRLPEAFRPINGHFFGCLKHPGRKNGIFSAES